MILDINVERDAVYDILFIHRFSGKKERFLFTVYYNKVMEGAYLSVKNGKLSADLYPKNKMQTWLYPKYNILINKKVFTSGKTKDLIKEALK